MEKLQAKDATITNVDVVHRGATFIEVRLHRGIQTETLRSAYLDYSVSDGALSYGVDTPVRYRRCGLNKLLVAYVLNRHPEIHGARLNLSESNYEGFMRHVVRAKKGDAREPDQMAEAAIKLLLSAKSPAKVHEARRKILNAVLEGAPAGRIQNAIGKGALTRVIVAYTYFYSGEITLDFGAASAAGPQIFISEVNTEDSIRGTEITATELVPDGKRRDRVTFVVD